MSGHSSLYFAGVDLTETYHMYVSGNKTYNAPARVYTKNTIPGRNGSLLMNEQRLEDVNVVYHCFIHPDNFETDIVGLRNFLLSPINIGYQRIEDNYHPDEFRLGYYAGPFDPNVFDTLETAEFDLTFTCKPQRFLKTGEAWSTYSESAWITNPTMNPAYPKLRIYGTGRVYINHYIGNDVILSTGINVTTNDTYIDVDCELMDAYNGSTNRNNDIKLTRLREFPYFAPNDRIVRNRLAIITPQSAGGKETDLVSQVDVIPRWYRV